MVDIRTKLEMVEGEDMVKKEMLEKGEGGCRFGGEQY